ncbi:MAG: transcriptional regulator [Actinobacteria bacterium 13_2_20CM_2_71_6]|nr:MAG: transcriptional regulator [Actinobacteria bacterium 13_2_20CM_2_71_6]
MDLSPRRQPPTVRLRRLAAELRRLRAAASFTREQVSDQTAINSATLYRIETAKVRPQRRTLMALLDMYGVKDETRRAEMIALSQRSTEPGWLQSYDSELPEQYTTYISFEADARSLRSYESLFVPGLLQTEDYARAVIAGGLPMDDDEMERRVEARVRRQAVLDKKKPLKLWAIVDEAALRRQVGGPKVMAAQLQRLIAAARKPHVTVQVVSYATGAHPGMHGSFAVMDFPDAADPDLVYIESLAGDLFLEREAEVRRYASIFEQLRAAAMNPADSVRLLNDLAERI